MTIAYEWRGAFDSSEVCALHAQGFGPSPAANDWWTTVNEHSLGWVCARLGGQFVGFVNVAWDGGAHAFLLDTVVAAAVRGCGVGTKLVTLAAYGAGAARCEWLHVDFEDYLRGFYIDSCGFMPSAAGLLAL